jgi:hypothetical protein
MFTYSAHPISAEESRYANLIHSSPPSSAEVSRTANWHMMLLYISGAAVSLWASSINYEITFVNRKICQPEYSLTETNHLQQKYLVKRLQNLVTEALFDPLIHLK